MTKSCVTLSKKCLFIGSKSFGFSCLQTVFNSIPFSLCGIVTINDKGDTRSSYEDMKAFAKAKNIPFNVIKKQDQLEEFIAKIKPDLVIVICWYRLFSKEILKVPSFGFLCIHFSLLPKYRGGAPVVWAIINGEKETGFSIFKMAEGADTGDIYIQEKIPISDDEYIGDIYPKIEKSALEKLAELLPDIMSGNVQTYSQDISYVSYGSQRKPEDGYINWQWPAQKIYNFIRAQSKPYPGAFVNISTGKMIIWKASISKKQPYYGVPGQIAEFDGDCALVICGDNKAIRIEEIQLNNKNGTPKEVIGSINTRFK